MRLVPLSLLVPQSDPASFWTQVRTNVVSWLIIAAVGGTGYIAYTVPRMLQLVLEGQERLTIQSVEHQKIVTELQRRVTILELK